MGSRRKTGVESVRLPGFSRRAVIAATPVAAFGAVKPAAASAAPDDCARHCARWLAIDTRIERLQTRWARLESWLAQEHAWLLLSRAEQQASPWAKALGDIDGCLDVLFERRRILLESLPTCGPASMDSVIARLTVAERLVWPDDHPEAHALIAGSRQDLVVISRRLVRHAGLHEMKGGV